MVHTAGAYPKFRNIKRLGVFLLPLGWDASPSQKKISVFKQKQIRVYGRKRFEYVWMQSFKKKTGKVELRVDEA